MEIHPIATIHNAFKGKFGIPRQSAVASGVRSIIVFEPEYRNRDAVRGLEGFSHIWLIWEFSANRRDKEFRPTVRPPRLGGNSHMGVFATRSPFRPNPIGLSCVEIDHIEKDGSIVVKGADLMDGTPIYDIKPYIGYTDCKPDAECGFTEGLDERKLTVKWETEHAQIPQDEVAEIEDILQNDPRPSYQDDPGRVYGMYYRDLNIRFTIDGGGCLRIISVENTSR